MSRIRLSECSNMEYMIGMDIGGTNIRIGSAGRSGELEHFFKIPRGQILQGNGNMERLAAFLEDYIKKHRLGHRPKAIMIGFPATLSRDRRTILQAPNIPGLDNLPAAEILEDLLNLPVYLERDVNLLFYRDKTVNRLPEQGVGIGIYVGTGIGNAIFINSIPLAGKDGAAGELGHIPLGGVSACGCGNSGCSECVASGKYLVQLQKEHFSATPLEEIFIRHGDTAVMRKYVDDIARVIASEINILNPDYIILGGGVLQSPGFPTALLKKHIYVHARKPYPAESLTYYFSRDALENGVLGALAYVWSIAETA